jgi:hypothetical protein
MAAGPGRAGGARRHRRGGRRWPWRPASRDRAGRPCPEGHVRGRARDLLRPRPDRRSRRARGRAPDAVPPDGRPMRDARLPEWLSGRGFRRVRPRVLPEVERGLHLNQITAIRWDQVGSRAPGRVARVVETPPGGFARAGCASLTPSRHEDEERRGLRALADAAFTQPRDGIWPAALALPPSPPRRWTIRMQRPPSSTHPSVRRADLVIDAAPSPASDRRGCTSRSWRPRSNGGQADEHFAPPRSRTTDKARSLLAPTQYEHARTLLRRAERDDRERDRDAGPLIRDRRVERGGRDRRGRPAPQKEPATTDRRRWPRRHPPRTRSAARASTGP